MKTKDIVINNMGEGMDRALDETEKLASDSSLSDRDRLHLRLLAEELFGMMRSITGEINACYHVEQKDRSFKMCLAVNADMTQEMKKTLLSVSSSGKNTAAKGFMGKIKDMITTSFLPSEEGPSMLQLGLMNMGSPNGYSVGENFEWSMVEYRNSIRNVNEEAAKEAWDELEKSIVANIADDVSVRIAGTDVEITITKSFS